MSNTSSNTTEKPTLNLSTLGIRRSNTYKHPYEHEILPPDVRELNSYFKNANISFRNNSYTVSKGPIAVGTRGILRAGPDRVPVTLVDSSLTVYTFKTEQNRTLRVQKIGRGVEWDFYRKVVTNNTRKGGVRRKKATRSRDRKTRRN